jgi:hypothetical protein
VALGGRQFDVAPRHGEERQDPLDIQKAMRPIKLRVGACRKYAPGRRSLVVVSITIDPSGTVLTAIPEEIPELTRLGKCVAKIARTARFPAFTGTPMTIKYPFVIR